MARSRRSSAGTGKRGKRKRDALGRFVGPGRKRTFRPQAAVAARRGGSGSERGVPARLLGKRVRDVERSIRTLGRERVKAGPIVIGKTRRLTPTRQGFRALDKLLLEIQRAHGTEGASAFTFDLQLRYRDKRGRFVNPPKVKGALLPRMADVRRRRKKGESMAGAFRRLVETEIKAATFRAAQDAPGIVDVGERYEKAMRLLEIARESDSKRAWQRVRKVMRELKAARALTLQLSITKVMT